MYVIKREHFVLLPLAFSDFCNDVSSLCESPNYSAGINIERIIDDKVIEDIVEYCKKSSKKLYILDMKNVITSTNKIFGKLLTVNDAKIIIVNLNSELFKSIKEDLNNKYFIFENGVLCSHKEIADSYKTHKREIQDIYHDEAVAIVNWMKQNVKKETISELKPLDSSGVYCNMYINAKRLFTDPNKYYFVVHQVICKIQENIQEVDAIVSASRNGANLASIIGWLTNKKVIHCSNLGPKFSMQSSSLHKDIRKNRKYMYIFDFLCLGTEVKVLNALLSYKGATLVYGIGIANYISLKENVENNVLGKMKSLVDVQKEKLGYKIAGTKEEIESMLEEDKRGYESGLYRV